MSRKVLAGTRKVMQEVESGRHGFTENSMANIERNVGEMYEIIYEAPVHCRGNLEVIAQQLYNILCCRFARANSSSNFFPRHPTILNFLPSFRTAFVGYACTAASR